MLRRLPTIPELSVTVHDLQAPGDDGAVLAYPDLADIGTSLRANHHALLHSPVEILDRPLGDLRSLARQETLAAARTYLAFSLNRVDDVLRRQNDRVQAARTYEESLGIERQLSENYPDDASVQEKYASRAKQVAELWFEIANVDGARKAYDDQFAGLIRLIDIRRKAVADGPSGPENLKEALSEATWAGLLSNHPREVIAFADDVLKLDPNRLAVETNRATALLLSGRVAEARAIYDKLSKIAHPNDARLTWIEYVKDDLALLRRLGITNPDVEQVVKDLGL